MRRSSSLWVLLLLPLAACGSGSGSGDPASRATEPPVPAEQPVPAQPAVGTVYDRLTPTPADLDEGLALRGLPDGSHMVVVRDPNEIPLTRIFGEVP